MNGNWVNFAPMVAGWILLIAVFIFAVVFVAQGSRRASSGYENGYVDD
jgi:uncharacterized membrane protein (DUF106 family)